MSTLPTSGRVLIQTTVGDIDIELWAKETPLACRNFITLALEGYYDGVIFHRVVPGFLVQTGDRSGTGNGGESFYGEPFEDEVHPRLRFTHRGLVGMANNGEKHSNTSQFFLTLDRADELQGKHTLFGRVIGDTIYNVMKIGELELGEDERPVYPPKIKQIKITQDPFGDIVPRITAAEKRAQQLAKEKAQREREEANKRKKGKKDSKLLSFGDDADDGEPVQFKKKPMFRTDLIDDGSAGKGKQGEKAEGSGKAFEGRGTSTSGAVNEALATPEMPSAPTTEEVAPVESRRKKEKEKKVTHLTEAERKKAELERVENEIRKLTRQRDSDSEEDKPAKKPKTGNSIIELQNAKYQRGTAAARRTGRKKDESDVIKALQNFRGKLQQVQGEAGDTNKSMEITDEHSARSTQNAQDPSTIGTSKDGEGGAGDGNGEDEGMEVDDDVDWLRHRLHFTTDDAAETARAEHDYEVIDPRTRGAKAKEEEMERKRAKKDGGRGYRHPPPPKRRADDGRVYDKK